MNSQSATQSDEHDKYVYSLDLPSNLTCDEIILSLEQQYQEMMTKGTDEESEFLNLQSLLEWMKTYKDEVRKML